MQDHYQHLYEMLSKVEGYIYPNEIELQWGILVVLYPYLTGLVAGAFILASLERVFKIKVLRPTYQLALLTALAFLIVAPLTLVSHLGDPGLGMTEVGVGRWTAGLRFRRTHHVRPHWWHPSEA